MLKKFKLEEKITSFYLVNKAMKTAINAVAPIEPFKLFYKIEKGVIAKSIKADHYDETDFHQNRPAGLSQLGYACFWPNR